MHPRYEAVERKAVSQGGKPIFAVTAFRKGFPLWVKYSVKH